MLDSHPRVVNGAAGLTKAGGALHDRAAATLARRNPGPSRIRRATISSIALFSSLINAISLHCGIRLA